MLFSYLDEIKRAGVKHMRLDFTVEDPKQTAEVLEHFGGFTAGADTGSAGRRQEHCTNGHYKRGVE